MPCVSLDRLGPDGCRVEVGTETWRSPVREAVAIRFTVGEFCNNHRMRKVRDLEHADVAVLQELLESVPDYAERITGYPPGPSDALSALISVPPEFDPSGKRSIGLWDGTELIAFADVLLGYPDPGAAYIGLLIVRGDRHGSGYGREIHETVLALVQQQSCAVRMRLGIVETNAAAAEPFWRTLGYRPTGERKPYRYDKLTSTVHLWERPILPSA